ncbi:MAG: hypothetical protein LBL21_02620 [Rickettsiales bacterium]|nr:hypothetical protein [Rickettsiales bacterium]
MTFKELYNMTPEQHDADFDSVPKPAPKRWMEGEPLNKILEDFKKARAGEEDWRAFERDVLAMQGYGTITH